MILIYSLKGPPKKKLYFKQNENKNKEGTMDNFTLRAWQINAVDNLKSSEGNMMIQAATGAGKTMMVCAYLQETDRSALIIVHNLRLLSQWQEALSDFGIDYHLFHGTNRDFGGKKVVLSTFQTLGSRIHDLKELNVQDIFADEAHKACSETYMDIYTMIPLARRCGITATPINNSQDLMRELYGDLMTTSTLDDLFEQDILVQPCLISPSGYFNSVKHRLKMAGDDYSSDSIGRIARYKGGDAYGCVQAYQEYVMGDENERTLVFATDIMHSKAIEKSFKDEGIEARTIISTTKTDVRNEIFADFKAGRLKVIISVEVLTEGFDERLAKHAIIARPTKSLSKGLQIFGRVMRSDPKKSDCQIIDLAGTFLSVGLPTWNVEWDKVYTGNGRGFIDFEELPDDSPDFEPTNQILQMHCTQNKSHGMYLATIHEDYEGNKRYSKCPDCLIEEHTTKLELVEVALGHATKAKEVWTSAKGLMRDIFSTSREFSRADVRRFIGRVPARRKAAGNLNVIHTTLSNYPYGETWGYSGGWIKDYDAINEMFEDLITLEKLAKATQKELQAFTKAYKELVGKDHQESIRSNAMIFSKVKGYKQFLIKPEYTRAIKQVVDIKKTLKGPPKIRV